MAIERVQQMTVEEFLDFAELSEERYEYIDGELIPITSAKFNHNVICYNLAVHLGILLADAECQVLLGQGIGAAKARFFMPDVVVVCGEPQTEADTRILLNPILVVEVTSPSSIDHDRVVKRDFYVSVASINAYLIVDQHRMLAELYTRSETGWNLQTFSQPGDQIPLEALDCRLSLSDIYQRIDFEAEPPSAPSDNA